jgi:DNA polymerase V
MNKRLVPLVFQAVNAGFPSPAEDFTELALDLHEYLIPRPASTFFLRVSGDSMCEAGILSEDILVVDRSQTAVVNDIVIASLEGDFTVKQLQYERGHPILVPANRLYSVIRPEPESDFQLWGVVTGVVRCCHTSNNIK